MMPKNPILVFDATVLANGNTKSAGRSGIFWVAWNLFNQFLKQDSLTVWLYCELRRYAELRKFLEQQFPGREFTFINCRGVFTRMYSKINFCKEKAKQKHQIVKKELFHLVGIPFRLARELERGWIKNLQFVSYFFSPAAHPPTVFKDVKHIRQAVILHDAMPVLYPHFFPERSAWFMELYHNLNRTDLYFAVSESTRRDFLKIAPQIPPQHITTAYIATNQPYQPEENNEKLSQVKAKYHIPAEKSYVFSLCNMELRKNISLTIHGFIHFCEQNNIHDQILVLGGNVQDKRLDKYKQSPYVKFIGYVDDEDLQTLYSAAHAFVYTSLYEGFGMPILEAMSCGCPVICSNTSSMPEVLGDCGLLIDPTNEQTLVDAFEHMHRDAAFRQSCREKGLMRAKQFSWEKCMGMIKEKLLVPCSIPGAKEYTQQH